MREKREREEKGERRESMKIMLCTKKVLRVDEVISR